MSYTVDLSQLLFYPLLFLLRLVLIKKYFSFKHFPRMRHVSYILLRQFLQYDHIGYYAGSFGYV